MDEDYEQQNKTIEVIPKITNSFVNQERRFVQDAFQDSEQIKLQDNSVYLDKMVPR